MTSIGHAHVAKSSVAGSGLFASQDIVAGDLIFFLARPAVAALDTNNLGNVCANCFASAAGPSVLHGEANAQVTVKACTGCKILKYCSKQCQAESWSRHHKSECKIFRSTSSKGILPHAARALLQMMALTPSVDDSPFKGLNSHLDDIAKAGGEQYENLLVLATGIHQYSQTKLDLAYLHQCLAMIFTNTFSLLTPTYDPLGICLDPFAARANHSCTPNVFIVFDGPRMSFRALQPISKDAELFVSYIDASNPFHRRQRELSKRYFFACHCSKCQKGIHTLEDRFRTDPATLEPGWDRDIQWPPSTVPGFTTQDPDDNDRSNYINDSAAGARLSATQRLAFASLEAAQRNPDPRSESAVDSLQVALSLCLKTQLWPEHRQPLPAVRQYLFATFLSFKLGLRLYFSVNPVLYPAPFHPLRVVHTWALLNLLLYSLDPTGDNAAEAEMREAGVDFGVVVYGLLSEVASNVERSHGRESAFAREVRRKVEEVSTDMTRGDRGVLRGIRGRMEEQWGILRRLAESKELENALG